MADPESASRQPSQPERWLAEHADHLYGYALLRVGRAELAEDLVQETLLAAFESRTTYAGRSSERTWLVGILKHKLVDRLRRESKVAATSELGLTDQWLDALYDQTGHWADPPGRWGVDPAQIVEQREFWEAFERCRAGLPDRLREVFSLRLLDNVPAEEVCGALDISAANLWTLLHRRDCVCGNVSTGTASDRWRQKHDFVQAGCPIDIAVARRATHPPTTMDAVVSPPGVQHVPPLSQASPTAAAGRPQIGSRRN